MRSDEAAHYSPILYLDEREPFSPFCAGFSPVVQSGPSPSFLREITLDPPAVQAIEYALWWEWDIGHLLELEHVWVYLDSSGTIVGCEGSWHGFYQPIEANGVVPLENGHPIVYVQPGQHACASSPEDFEGERAETERACGPEAGRGGLLISHLYLDRLQKERADDERIRAYLQQRAFIPSWRFTRRIQLKPDQLLPWPELFDLIPVRVSYWLNHLRSDNA